MPQKPSCGGQPTSPYGVPSGQNVTSAPSCGQIDAEPRDYMHSDAASQGGGWWQVGRHGWWQGGRHGWWRGLLHRAPPASRLRDEQHGVGSCALQPCRFGGGVDSDSTPARSHEPASRGSLYWSG